MSECFVCGDQLGRNALGEREVDHVIDWMVVVTTGELPCAAEVTLVVSDANRQAHQQEPPRRSRTRAAAGRCGVCGSCTGVLDAHLAWKCLRRGQLPRKWCLLEHGVNGGLLTSGHSRISRLRPRLMSTKRCRLVSARRYDHIVGLGDLVQVRSSIASRFRRPRRNLRVRPASPVPTTPIQPLDFPEDTEPASETQPRLDWFSSDLYAFGLDKSRQG